MRTAMGTGDPYQDLADAFGAWLDYRVAWELRREAPRIWVRQATRWESERRCMHCGAPVVSYDQEGKCYYANPCGHRQGQGRSPDHRGQ